MNHLMTEKRLQPDFSEEWQVLSPASNKWITMKNQDDKSNEERNKLIMLSMKAKV